MLGFKLVEAVCNVFVLQFGEFFVIWYSASPSYCSITVCFIFIKPKAYCKPLFFFSSLSLSWQIKKAFYCFQLHLSEKVYWLENDVNILLAMFLYSEYFLLFCTLLTAFCTCWYLDILLYLWTVFDSFWLSLKLWFSLPLYLYMLFVLKLCSWLTNLNHELCSLFDHFEFVQFVYLCISYFLQAFLSFFVNQEQSCDLQRGQTDSGQSLLMMIFELTVCC